jgi:hypothetical protein
MDRAKLPLSKQIISEASLIEAIVPLVVFSPSMG